LKRKKKKAAPREASTKSSPETQARGKEMKNGRPSSQVKWGEIESGGRTLEKKGK